MSRYIVTRFRLGEGDTVESYAEWSAGYLRPTLRAYPSVIGFLDFTIAHDDGAEHWDLCELIEVTDFEAFAQDESTGDGAVLAAAWRERVDSWSIARLEDLLPIPAPLGRVAPHGGAMRDEKKDRNGDCRPRRKDESVTTHGF